MISMKKLRLIFCGLMLSVALIGCGNGGDVYDVDYTTISGRTFKVITEDTGIPLTTRAIYIDVDTKVQYIRFNSGYFGSMSVLVDADGKPILYDGEV